MGGGPAGWWGGVGGSGCRAGAGGSGGRWRVEVRREAAGYPDGQWHGNIFEGARWPIWSRRWTGTRAERNFGGGACGGTTSD